MKGPILAAVASIVLAGCAARTTEGDSSQQAALAEALAERTAGDPVDCVNLRDLRGNRGYGEDAILFEGRTNALVYLNRPPAGCPELRSTRALRIESTTGRLCRGDIVTVYDPGTGVEFGSCSLGEFVPYRR